MTLADYPLAPGATWLYRTYDTIDTGEHGVAEERGSLTVRTLAVHRHGDLTVATQETRRVVNAETETQISWQVIETGAAPAGETAASAPAPRPPDQSWKLALHALRVARFTHMNLSGCFNRSHSATLTACPHG